KSSQRHADVQPVGRAPQLGLPSEDDFRWPPLVVALPFWFTLDAVMVRLAPPTRRSAKSTQSAHFPSGHLCGDKVTAMDGALEASVCCALACHRVMPLGRRLSRS